MGDVSNDEIIELCPHITNRMIDYMEHYLYSIKEFKNKYMNDDILKSKDLISSSDEIEELLKNYYESVNKNVSEVANDLNLIYEETEKLKAFQNILEKEIVKNKKSVEILKRDVSNINRQKESLANKRDEVLTCKLLTKTTFLYKGKNVSGYVAGNKIQPFDLDSEALSNNDIIEKLYNSVKKDALLKGSKAIS